MSLRRSPSTVDRRVQRSQRALLDALTQLLVERGFEQTTIADIAERANVGRSTFYAHFADKEALLRESLQGLRVYLAEAAAALPRANVHPALAFSLPLLSHVNASRDLFAAIVTRRSSALDLVQGMLVELVSDALCERPLPPDVPLALTAEHIVGSFLSICRWWLNEAPTLDAVDVDRAFRHLMAGLELVDR